MVERALPLGQHCPVGEAEGKCFTLAEWQSVGHLVIDYRALLAWADRAEVLYAAAQVHAAGAQAVAAVQGGRVDAALAREQVALGTAADAKADAKAADSKSRRMGLLAAVLGGAVIVLGGVVGGLAAN
jgi:ABC-type amino acid transport substrate-binding protein